MTQRHPVAISFLLTTVLAMSACSTTPPPPPERPVEYRFEDRDALVVYQDMVYDCLRAQWRDDWERTSQGEAPRLLVANIRSTAEDYIDTRLFTKRLEEELLETRQVRMVTDPDQQQDLLQHGNPEPITPAMAIARAELLGADYVMLGWVGEHQTKPNPNSPIKEYFQVSLDLIKVSDNQKVWTRTVEIDKQRGPRSVSRRR